MEVQIKTFIIDGGSIVPQKEERQLTAIALAKKRALQAFNAWLRRNPCVKIIGSKFNEIYDHDGDTPLLGYSIEILYIR